MKKITFIGAGSMGFTRSLVRDLLTFPLLEDAKIVLMDINKERLGFSLKAIKGIIEIGNYPATVEATTDRKKALKGADFVLCTVLQGGVKVWRHDIEIPKKYGVDFNVGDTRGVSGIFRALRTIPLMLDICRDMEKLCPNAYLLNYTNPMAMLCRAMQKETKIKVTGLCHSVQGTAGMLANWIGSDLDHVTYVCAGINHQAWYLEFKKDGKDAYPLLRKAVAKKEIYRKELVRNEMFLALDYYLTESSGHNSEYNWWFRKRQDLIKKYCLKGRNWNPGEYAFILKDYIKAEKTWKKSITKWLNKWLKPGAGLNLKRGHEYAAYIMNAISGGDPFEFNGNVPNTGIITNLPNDVCVEVPVLANKRGYNSIHVGALPPQCAALNNLNVAVEEMAVEAIISGNPKLLYQAVAHEPVSASVLSLREIRSMVTDMMKINRRFMPQFKSIKL